MFVVVGMDSTWESEGFDRKNIDLPTGQDDLIRAVAAVNPNTVVVVNAGAPVAMPWRDDVAGIVQLWYLGQEAGNGLADVLTGAVDASGRLPTTFAHRLEDIPAMLNYPGENGEVLYGEGLFIGYRAFDKTKTEPLYPFGFGLSYTTFEYSDLQVTPRALSGGNLTVKVAVRNSGQRAGAEVVQLYLRDRVASITPSVRRLKRFAKLWLAPGESRELTFTLTRDDLSFIGADNQPTVEAGDFDVMVGPLSSSFTLAPSTTSTTTKPKEQ